jgi:hypothetical protein
MANPKDWGSMFLRNGGICLYVRMASQQDQRRHLHRRQNLRPQRLMWSSRQQTLNNLYIIFLNILQGSVLNLTTYSWNKFLLRKLTVAQPINKTSSLFCNSKCHYSVPNSQWLIPILNKMYRVHTRITTNFSKIHSNSNPPRTPPSSKLTFSHRS